MRSQAIAAYHDEVVAALEAIGDPRWGAAIQKDRGSKLPHLGISFPDLRRRVKQGFSFYGLPEDRILAIWDALWRESPYGDVLFAALEYYAPRVKKNVSPGLWPVVRGWVDRVDNWCHADAVGGIYSRILEAYPGEVYPHLQEWNTSDRVWLRRISIVSLIHYSGKNAVFLPPNTVLPLISNCLDDRRDNVQKAVGWVLREMGHAYPQEIRGYIEANISTLSSTAFTRAIERRSPAEREQLRELRKRSP